MAVVPLGWKSTGDVPLVLASLGFHSMIAWLPKTSMLVALVDVITLALTLVATLPWKLPVAAQPGGARHKATASAPKPPVASSSIRLRLAESRCGRG